MTILRETDPIRLIALCPEPLKGAGGFSRLNLIVGVKSRDGWR